MGKKFWAGGTHKESERASALPSTAYGCGGQRGARVSLYLRETSDGEFVTVAKVWGGDGAQEPSATGSRPPSGPGWFNTARKVPAGCERRDFRSGLQAAQLGRREPLAAVDGRRDETRRRRFDFSSAGTTSYVTLMPGAGARVWCLGLPTQARTVRPCTSGICCAAALGPCGLCVRCTTQACTQVSTGPSRKRTRVVQVVLARML